LCAKQTQSRNISIVSNFQHHNRDQFHASLLDLCAWQRSKNSTLPNMFLGAMTLVVHDSGWPPPGHSLVATSIGLNNTCLDKQRYFPCVMMDTPRSDITTHLKFCVPQDVVCDGILNCPASGADEIPLLCGQQNDSSSKVTEQLRRLSEKTHLDLYNNMSHVAYDELGNFFFLISKKINFFIREICLICKNQMITRIYNIRGKVFLCFV
jgi:hypothetical protein